MGLPILESESAAARVETGDEIEIDLTNGSIVSFTKSQRYQAEAIPEFMRVLLKSGGLIPYVQQKLKQENKNG
jgi:3-isopropylmalate/(R)-2-methylmalate dehydratase small subunit